MQASYSKKSNVGKGRRAPNSWGVVAVISFVILTTGATSLAQGSGPFGLGLVIGAPTGLTGKYNLNATNAIDGALAWDLDGDGNFLVQSSYLWHKSALFRIDGEPIDLYYGVGGRLASRKYRARDWEPYRDEALLGVRGPLGLRHVFRKVPIEVFLEVALTLNLIPRTSADFDLGLGGRYYF